MDGEHGGSGGPQQPTGGYAQGGYGYGQSAQDPVRQGLGNRGYNRSAQGQGQPGWYGQQRPTSRGSNGEQGDGGGGQVQAVRRSAAEHPADRGASTYRFDDVYRSWRDRQLAEHDRDYEEYRAHKQKEFHSDFEQWRQGKQGLAQHGSGTGHVYADGGANERSSSRGLSQSGTNASSPTNTMAGAGSQFAGGSGTTGYGASPSTSITGSPAASSPSTSFPGKA